MKKVFFILSLFISTYASATPYSPMDCVADAVSISPKITNGIVTKLCANASSIDPVMCYGRIAELDEGISVGISADLCSRSTNYKQTLLCYAEAADQKLNRGLSQRLCAGSGSTEPSKCAARISRVDSEISKGIAVEVCAGSTNAEKTIACYGKAASTFNRGMAITLCGAKEYVTKQ
jgi:hypothetical protein